MRVKLMAVLATAMMALGAGVALGDVGPTSEEPPDEVTGEESNQVSCDGEAGADALDQEQGSIRVTAGGDGSGSGGYLVVCNDGEDAPVEGRIYGEGNATSGGALCADGDADNDDSAQGWACLGGTAGGPTLECSDQDTGGTSNSENREGTDVDPSNCG